MPSTFLMAPGPVFNDPNQQKIHDSSTLTTSGSQVLTGYGSKELNLIINITASPTGTLPTIQYSIVELDPGDQTTVIGTPQTGAVLNSVSTQIITLPNTKSGVVKVSWTITGTTPSFTGVYASLNTKTSSGEITDGVNVLGTVGNPLVTTNVGAASLSIPDPGNSTTTPLAPNAVFTGTSFDTLNYPSSNISIEFVATGSNPILLEFQWSPDNINWDTLYAFDIFESTPQYFNINHRGRYFRLKLNNDIVAQTSLRLYTFHQGVSVDDNNISFIAGQAIQLGQANMSGSFPIVIAADQTIIPVNATLALGAEDPGNSTTTPLAPNAVFTGVGFDTLNYPSFDINVKFVASGAVPELLEFQWSPDNINWDTLNEVDVAESVDSGLNINHQGRYFRIKYTNSGTAHTQFRLSVFHKAVSVSTDNIQSVGGLALNLGQTLSQFSLPVVISSDQTAVPISGTVTSNIGNTNGLALDATLTGGTQTSRLTDGTNTATVTGANALKVDGSAVTQPVSGTVTANQGGSWTTIVTQATAANLNATVTGTVAATQSGSWTVTSNIGTTGGLALDSTLSKLTVSQGSLLGSNTQILTGGSVSTLAPSYTNGQISPLSLTTAGALRTDSSATTQPISGTVTANIGITNGLALNATLTGGTQTSRLTDGTNTATVTGANALKVDGSAVTQPVSSTQLPSSLVGGRLDENIGSWLGSTAPTVGQKTSANSIPVVLASDQILTVTASEASVGLNNSLAPTSSDQIGGSDGTNLQAGRVFDLDTGAGTEFNFGVSLRLPASGGSVVGGTSANPLRIDPTGTTTQPVSGTVTANIGTTNGLALDATLTGGTQTSRLTDGTNTATVKAASTAAVATDKALVVAISPNNTILTSNASVGVDGSPIPTSSTLIGASDGTNLQQLLVESSTNRNLRIGIYSGANEATVTGANALKVDGSAVTQPVSGTVTANQGGAPWSNNLTQIAGSAITTVTSGEQKVAVEGISAVLTPVTGNPVLIGSKDDSGNLNYIRTDLSGNTKVVGAGFPDLGNSTTTPLGSNATFTGTAFDTLNYPTAEISVFANVDSNPFIGLSFQWSPNGTNWDVASSSLGDFFSVIGTVGRGYHISHKGRYFRAVYTNGSSAQSAFRLDVIHRTSAAGLLTSPLGVDDVQANSYALITKSVLFGKNAFLGTYKEVLVDGTGKVITASEQDSTITNYQLITGSVISAASTLAKVEATTYTEQVTNAQRSLVSSSASDTSAGTGARTIKITYLDSGGGGPFNESVTLNGITAVNTLATNICFIEKMEVTTVGTGGSNVGIISLKASTGGAGATIGSIGVATVHTGGDNKTLWAHHYVPLGTTCNITSILTAKNVGTSATTGGLFFVKSIAIGVSNAVDIQVTDYIEQFGQSSSFNRQYDHPIQVVGPARLTGYVQPESASSTTYHLSISLFEQ